MPNTIKTIIFDVDGVLVDSEKIHFKAYKKILGEYGQDLSWSNYKKYFSGRSIKGGITSFAKDYHLPQAVDFDNFLPLFTDKKITSTTALFKNHIAFFDETIQFIKKVAKGNIELKNVGFVEEKPILALATGMEDDLIREVLKHHNLKNLISIAITPSYYKNSKPHPESYLVTLDKIRVNANEAVGVEDSPAGVDALNTAGIFSIGLTTSHTASELSKAKIIVSSLSEVIV